VIVPDGQTAAPARPATVNGPQIRLATGTRQRHRTYPSLLQDEYDEHALEHYLTGQLALLDTDGRGVRKIGAPAMIIAVDPSPFGDHFRMRLVRKPFSYIVPYADFGEVEQLWDANGKVLIELGTRPLRDGTERRTNGDGANVASSPPRRSLAWHPSGVGLTYLQRAPAQAGGDEVPDSAARAAASPDSAKKRAIASLDSAANSADTAPARTPATRPDRLYHWLPPFGPEDARVLYESENALSTVRFAEDGESIFVTEYVDGGSHTYAVHLNSPERRYTLLRIERPVTAADSAAAELARGSIEMRDAPGKSGRVVRRSTDGRYIYLDGLRRATASPGNASPTPADTTSRPFVDRVEIATGARERLYHAPAGEVVELLTSVVDDDVTRILVRREARTIVPDYYLRDPRAGTLTPLTRNTDHAPEITHARRDRIQVTRPDGFRFWVNLTLPRDYREGTRLPAFFWFYPREYANQEAYDRMVFEIPNRFQVPGPRSLEFLVTQGYAVVQPDAPVVGPQGRINDNYLHDLRNNLAAVIDELDRRGYIDRGRLGLGGHSYGAFSTVNAMIHTPFFRAGIAGDGNYNRTLTPNGFQTEERDLWERRETYLELSPLLYADRLTGALLLYHGLADQNPGTDPVNSIRLLQALQGLGKTAALYLYHHEDHEPQARETILDMWARWTAWLDRYLKAAGPGSVATTGADRTASPRETAAPVRP
jgi:dipeptidyl aminopeptidase/acylaminoacyl peptidase